MKRSSQKAESSITATHCWSVLWHLTVKIETYTSSHYLIPPVSSSSIKAPSLMPHPYLSLNMLRIYYQKTKCSFIIQAIQKSVSNLSSPARPHPSYPCNLENLRAPNLNPTLSPLSLSQARSGLLAMPSYLFRIL